MAGTFGYEMDVRLLCGREREQIRRQIQEYRRCEPVIRQGDYYRLTDPQTDTCHAAWQFVTKDKKKSVVSVVLLRAEANPPFRQLRLRGLQETAKYRIDGDERIYTGSALMYAGLPVPVLWGDYQSIHFYIQQI